VTTCVSSKAPTDPFSSAPLRRLSVSRLLFSFLSSLVSFLSCDGLVYHIKSHFLSFVSKIFRCYTSGLISHSCFVLGLVFLHPYINHESNEHGRYRRGTCTSFLLLLPGILSDLLYQPNLYPVCDALCFQHNSPSSFFRGARISMSET